MHNNFPNLLKSGNTQSAVTLSSKQNRSKTSPSNSMALVKQDESLNR